jgi:hypothetical protein
LRRLPRLKELGKGLDEFLLDYQGYRSLILVGHSQGGLVIQSYLTGKLEAAEGKGLANVSNVILFATPNFGSAIFSGIRRLFYGIVTNPQESTLQVLNADTGDICRRVERDIFRAAEITSVTCPIPFKAFWGEQDNVVREASARGCFDEGAPLPGDHFSIVRPSALLGRDDRRYRALRNGILEPPGHPAFFELDKFEVQLGVSPGDPKEMVTINGKEHSASDNRANRRMTLRFSKSNRCCSLFNVNYRSSAGVVRSLGFTEPNLAREDEKVGNESPEASVFNYSFRPDPEGLYFSVLEIYNGFGRGNRNWHHHLQQNLRCASFTLSLDLSGYIKARYVFSKTPRLSYLPGHVEDESLCGARESFQCEKPITEGPDTWVWEVRNLRSGVVDVSWDFEDSPLLS